VRDSGSSVEWTLDDSSGGMADRLEETVATSLFRIVQEAINNAIRHAHASRLRVAFRNKGGRLHVEVADNGIGMDRQTQRPDVGHGIDNMRTRARLISASFAIRKNGEGGGTSVTIHLPAEMCREGGG
jgi:signal transduction histidine kinase